MFLLGHEAEAVELGQLVKAPSELAVERDYCVVGQVFALEMLVCGLVGDLS
jgi:hypothetical protein